MTAKEALDAANDAAPVERLCRYELRCGPRGLCRHEPCAGDAGRWTWCPDCLTVFDDYGEAFLVPTAAAPVPTGVSLIEKGGRYSLLDTT